MNKLPIEPLNLPDKGYSGLSKILIDSIRDADNNRSKLEPKALQIEALSSHKNKCMLNNLLSYDGIRYLEIGTYKGASLVSALYKNKPEYHAAIDSFKGFEWMLNEFKKNCFDALDYYPNFINADCYSINPLELNIKNINVYYYDGNHSREDTAKSLPYYYDSLANDFIYIVDDFNRAEVATGTFEAIRDTDVKLNFARVLPAHGDGDRQNWWSGVFVSHCTKR